MESNNAMQTWNPPVKTTTSGNSLTAGCVQMYPYDYPNHSGGCIPNWWPQQYIYTTVQPQICSGDVHVFPCPHCEKCKCGAATVKRSKKESR